MSLVHCQSVLQKNPTFLAQILLKRPQLRYFRLPHGVSIHPQRNKITVAQCQNWERNKQRALGRRIQHLIYGHRRRLVSRLAHHQAWRRTDQLHQLTVCSWKAGTHHQHSQHGCCLKT